MRRGIYLQERDYEVVKFVYDMKFSCTSDIYQKFFLGKEVKSSRYAFNRLKKLEREGFLRSSNISTFNTRYYLISTKGLYLLRSHYREELFPVRATDRIDTRQFEHDRFVSLCRIGLERKGLASDWISERNIIYNILTKSGEYQSKYMFQNLKQASIPDGLFVTKKGERVAFELEFSKKSTRALTQKLQNLHQEMNSSRGYFQRTLIVAGGNKIQSSIESLTKNLGESFKVMSLDDVLKYGDAYGK